MSTVTVPLEQHITDADREAALALINRWMPMYAAGMHVADLATLRHEAARLDGLPTSPVVQTLRRIVDAELSDPRHLLVEGVAR